MFADWMYIRMKPSEVEQLINITMNKKKIFSLLSAFLFVSIAFASSNGKGIDYYRAGLYGAAKIFFTSQSYQSAGDQAESYYYLGLIAYDTDDMDQAIQAFSKAVETDPTYPFGLIGQGKIALYKGNKKEAEDLFKKAGNLAKKNPAIQTEIAAVYVDAGMNAEANKALEKARTINKKYSGIYMVEGDILAKAEKIGDAAARYENAITFDKNDKIAYLKLARVYKSVNPTMSLNYLDRLITIDPDYIPAYAEIGDINYSTGYYGRAIDAYEKFISIPGVPLKQQSNYAELLYFTDQYEKSLQQINTVLQQEPDNLIMFRIRAYNNFKLKNYELALQEMQDFLKKMSEDKHIYLDYMTLGRIYTELKQPENAITAFIKAGEIDDTKLVDIYRELTTAYENAKDYPNAIITYDKYFETSDNIQPLDYLYYGQDNYQAVAIYMDKVLNGAAEEEAMYMDSLNYYAAKGEQAFTKLVELRPDSYHGYLWRANINSILDAVEYAKTEKMSGKAKPYFEEAINVMIGLNESGARTRDIISGYDYLSNYYFIAGDTSMTIEYNKKILELDPENAKAKQTLEALKVKY